MIQAWSIIGIFQLSAGSFSVLQLHISGGKISFINLHENPRFKRFPDPKRPTTLYHQYSLVALKSSLQHLCQLARSFRVPTELMLFEMYLNDMPQWKPDTPENSFPKREHEEGRAGFQVLAIVLVKKKRDTSSCHSSAWHVPWKPDTEARKAMRVHQAICAGSYRHIANFANVKKLQDRAVEHQLQ